MAPPLDFYVIAALVVHALVAFGLLGYGVYRTVHDDTCLGPSLITGTATALSYELVVGAVLLFCACKLGSCMKSPPAHAQP